MTWSNRQKLALVLLFGLGVLSVGAWDALARGVLIEDASSFLIPTLWFTPLFLFLLLGSILWQEKSFLVVGSILVVVPSVWQAMTVSHTVIVIFSTVLILMGLLRIQNELTARVRLSIRRSIGAGMALLLLGMTITLSSQYFVHVQSLSWERLVPSFDLAEGVGPLLLRILRPISPELGQLQDTTVTVDNFLTEVQNKNNLDPQLSAGNPSQFWNEELQRTKRELGRLLGREVSGTENMQAILSEVLRKKTIAFFSNETQNLPIPVLPFFLSFLLFLTLYPLLAFLVPLVGIVAGILFRIFRRFGWVTVTSVTTEQEKIEP